MTATDPARGVGDRPTGCGADAAGHVVVLAFPDYGHLRPLVAMTRQLVERGHRVSWITDQRYAELAGEAGAELVGYRSRRPSFGAGPVATAAEMGELGLAVLAEAIEVVLPRARRHLATDPPDLMLYDFESALTARTLARDLGCGTMQVFCNLASGEHWSLHAAIFDPGADSVTRTVELVSGFLGDSGRDPAEIWSLLTPYDERNLVLLPRQLQPAGDGFDARYTFVGHGIDPAAGSPIEWSPPPGAGPLTLVSLGTEAHDPHFFPLAGRALADGGGRVVMTLGRHAAPDGPPTIPGVQTHAWLPHTAVLPHADAFVTHGGMGSILESLYFGVPMVVVPHMPEPELNGRQLERLGVGRVLPMADLTATSLARAVAEVAADPVIRARAARLREVLRSSGGPALAAETVHAALSHAAP